MYYTFLQYSLQPYFTGAPSKARCDVLVMHFSVAES